MVSHRAAVYTVTVHSYREPGKLCLLGDIDNRGSSLLPVFEGYLKTLDVRNRSDTSKSLRFLQSKQDGNDLLVTLEYGQDGVEAVIRDQSGARKYHQQAEDWQNVECGCLLSFAPNEQVGWLALHINNGRGTKTLLERHLMERFRVDFPGLTLTINPYVMESALRQAVRDNLIREVTLVKREQPGDRAEAGLNPWVESRTVGKIETTIKASLSGKAQRLAPEPLRRFLDDGPEARDAIVEFRGETYDEVKVTVQQGDTIRTYNIEKPGSGHPVSVDMGLKQGRPAAEDVYAALRQALPASLS
jgi:hypothetical protein